jgi:hypothetical protein
LTSKLDSVIIVTYSDLKSISNSQEVLLKFRILSEILLSSLIQLFSFQITFVNSYEVGQSFTILKYDRFGIVNTNTIAKRVLIGLTFGKPPGVFNINSNTLDNRINPFEIAIKKGNSS